MKTAVITGASGGIGQALCDTFRSAGYRVIGLDLTLAPGCDEAIVIDLQNMDALSRVIELVGNRLDVLVNNAAVQLLGATEEVTPSDWERTMAINLAAPLRLAQALLGPLKEAQGTIVNISSIHARLTKPGFVAYATSKAALSGLTRALAADLARVGVRVVAVEPGAIETSMLVAGLAKSATPLETLAAGQPLGRLGNPQDVAAATLMAVTNPFMNGTSLAIDGGVGGRLYG